MSAGDRPYCTHMGGMVAAVAEERGQGHTGRQQGSFGKGCYLLAQSTTFAQLAQTNAFGHGALQTWALCTFFLPAPCQAEICHNDL